MKNRAIILIMSCFYRLGVGQNDLPKPYLEYIQKAEIFYQAKDYKNSAFVYSAAFKSLNWKGTPNDRWNAACSWALAKYPDSAYFNLFKLARKMGFGDYIRLVMDSDLNSLHGDKRWDVLLNVVRKNKDSLETGLNKSLVRELDSIYLRDQRDRLLLDELQTSASKTPAQNKKEQELFENIIRNDIQNLAKIKRMLDEHGWLGAKEISEPGNTTLFLVIQHSDLATQEHYLPMMREAVKKGNALNSELALLEDRIAIRKGKKQIYGSQLYLDNKTSTYVLSPVEDEINLNKRRASVGLSPIEEYVKHWGIT